MGAEEREAFVIFEVHIINGNYHFHSRSELYNVSPVKHPVKNLGVNDGYLHQHNVMSFVLLENHLFLRGTPVYNPIQPAPPCTLQHP